MAVRLNGLKSVSSHFAGYEGLQSQFGPGSTSG